MVLIVCVVAPSRTSVVVAGTLGAVAAGLAGYVSRTFVKTQEAASVRLRAYFDQPVEFSRYLAAERLISDSTVSEEDKAKLLGALVHAIVARQVTTDLGAEAA